MSRGAALNMPLLLPKTPLLRAGVDAREVSLGLHSDPCLAPGRARGQHQRVRDMPRTTFGSP